MNCRAFLLFLLPAVATAGVMGSCGPGPCNYYLSETIVSDVVTIEFDGLSLGGPGQGGSGTFTLNDTLLAYGSGTPGSVGLVALTFTAGVFGTGTATGLLGPTIGCGATDSQIPGPDTHPTINSCYHGGYVPITLGQIPLNLQVQFGAASSAGLQLQASFFEVDPQSGETTPLSVQFPVPEPDSFSLCALGLIAVGILRRAAKQA